MTNKDQYWWIWTQPQGRCSYCGGVALWHTQDRKEYCPAHLFIVYLKDEIAQNIERHFTHA